MSRDFIIQRIFTQKSQADKAIHSLKGILLGISLDDNINPTELNELKLWVEEHYSLIHRNPFREFMTTIYSVIDGSLPTKESLEDLYWLSQKYEGESYFYENLTTDLQILQGLCHGILADGVVTDDEIFNLEKWIEDNSHLESYFPYDELKALLLSITKDKKITEHERIVLTAFISQFADLKDAQIKSKIQDNIKDISIKGLCTSEPDITFENKGFCITGKMQSGERESVIKEIQSLGGTIKPSVSKNVDYLIVGDSGNPAWAFACYGRKVEQAIKLRKSGHHISIIHEYDFIDILEDNK